MNQEEVSLGLLGSINQEDSPITPPVGTDGRSLFEAGDYTYARNVRIGSSIMDNNSGAGENIPGTVKVSTYKTWNGSSWETSTYPSTGRFVGRRRDDANGRIFLAVKDDDDVDRIEMFVKSERATYLLLKWSGLQFGEFVKMDFIKSWLALTDRENQPRLIDVDSIHKTFNALGETHFREFHISFIKWSPSAPPIPRIYYDGTTNNFDKLKNKSYQFCHQYVYKGKLKSRYSPISKAAYLSQSSRTNSVYYQYNKITSIEVEIRGSILDVPGANVSYNYFDHDDVKFKEAVEYIQVVYRDSYRSPWRLWKRIYPSGGTFPSLIYFDGSVDGRIISDEDINEPFDTVPIKAGTVEAIDNRFVFGDCLNENIPYDEFSVDNIGIASSLISSTNWSDASPTSFSQFIDPLKSKLLRLNAMSQFTFKSRGLYKCGIIFSDETGRKSLTYTPENFVFEPTEVSNNRTVFGFKFRIPSSVKPPIWATSYQIVRTNQINVESFISGGVNKFVPLLDSASTLIGSTSLPQNIKDKLAQHFENSNIVDGYEVANDIKKAEAKDPTIQRRKSLNKFLDFNKIRFKIAPEIRTSTTTSAVAAASRIYIDINNWYNAPIKPGTTDNWPLNKIFYNFREGDRVRFNASTVSSPSSASDFQIFDLEILEFTGSGIIVEKPSNLLALPPNPPSGSVDLQALNWIEVYTPIEVPDNNSYIFYEMGEWYPVLYPGTSNRDFSKRDWRYTSNGEVQATNYGPFTVFHTMPIFFADCFANDRSINIDNGLAIYIPISMNPDPSKPSGFWEQNNGRGSVSYLDLPRAEFIQTQARFGGKFIENSLVNQLNHFKDEDQFIYPSEYGRIRDLVNTSNAQVESVGNILLAIGESQTWSIYVNRTTIEDLSGRTQVALSEKVLGSYNTLLGKYGTLNPESITIFRGRVVFWDQGAGAWIRYSRDGLTEISSEFNMKNWFKDLSIVISPSYTTTPSRVISGWDRYHERWVTHIDDHPDNVIMPESFKGYQSYKCITFSEAELVRGWKEWLDYSADFFDTLDNEFYSLKAGEVFIHDEDEDNCNTFYGVKYDSEIEFIVNPVFKMKKVLTAIGIVASNKWSVESITSEWMPNSGTQQQTSMALTDLNEKEGVYWVDVKRDVNTPNMGSEAIIEGAPIRGRYFKVRLKLDPSVTYLSIFNWLTSCFNISQKTVKS